MVNEFEIFWHGFVLSVCVQIWSAVLASSAIPMVLNPVTLMEKADNGEVRPHLAFGECWCDGSIKNDLPMREIAELFNVNYFIVSQCNPHIIPFYFVRGNVSCARSFIPFSLSYTLRTHTRSINQSINAQHLRGATGDPTRRGGKFKGGFLSSLLEVTLRLEMRKWLQIMGEVQHTIYCVSDCMQTTFAMLTPFRSPPALHSSSCCLNFLAKIGAAR